MIILRLAIIFVTAPIIYMKSQNEKEDRDAKGRLNKAEKESGLLNTISKTGCDP